MIRYILATITVAVLATAASYSQVSVFKIEQIPVSSPLFDEIAPVITTDGIIFCSNRKISSITDVKTYKGERLYNLYFAAKRDTTNRWNKPEEITAPGSEYIYYGPVSISSDGRTVYFTSSIITGKAARKKNLNNPLGIFIGDLSGRDISNIRPFQHNNSDYNTGHPSLSRDGRFLFFASDRPGGEGASDLYYCENINGSWSAPVNLGKKVNSPAKENYPYIHPSGRLYFSSDRSSSEGYMGKMDVYYTSLFYGDWEEPVAMPEPINSPDDDFAFTAEDNLQTGYFTRRERRTDDIYSFRSTIEREATCDTLQPNSYCYEFYEENALRFDTIPFRYIWNFGDGTSAEGKIVEHCFKDPGNYTVSFDVVNLITNEVKKNEKTFYLEVTRIEQAYISAPDLCLEGQPVKMNADSTYLPGWDIKEFYWNFDDDEVQIGKSVEKVYRRAGNYNIQLIVKAAPDANGVMRRTCVSKNIIVTRRP